MKRGDVLKAIIKKNIFILKINLSVRTKNCLSLSQIILKIATNWQSKMYITVVYKLYKTKWKYFEILIITIYVTLQKQQMITQSVKQSVRVTPAAMCLYPCHVVSLNCDGPLLH